MASFELLSAMQIDILIARDDDPIGGDLRLLQFEFQEAADFLHELYSSVFTSALVVFSGLILIVRGALVLSALHI